MPLALLHAVLCLGLTFTQPVAILPDARTSLERTALAQTSLARTSPTTVANDSVAPAITRTRHVLLVMTDGFRWQEVYHGADAALMTRQHGVRDVTQLRAEYWRDDQEARRRALFPFLWGTVANEGQLYGNQDVGSVVAVSNEYKFSYPGYSETFSGRADPNVNSNSHGVNENTTVFEWLNRKKGFQGRVAAIATWGAFTRILNVRRSGVTVYDGWQRGSAPSGHEPHNWINAILSTIKRYGRNGGLDAVTHERAMDYLATRKPRVLFVGFGETDDEAHNGRYDLYLRSAHRVDAYLKSLWDAVQADPEYRGNTTMLVTTDHGRGSGPTAWRDHGAEVAGSENIWLGVLGPDTPALGERRGGDVIRQAQVAATIALLLGEDFRAGDLEVAPGIAEVLGRTRRD